MKKEQGFSLIELLIVVAIIAIIAAIAVPSMLTSRMSANEAGAIQGCRTIGSAEVAYAAVNNQLYTTLATLTDPNLGSFLDSRFAAGGTFNGYTYAAGLLGGAVPGPVATLPNGFGFEATPAAADSTGRYNYGIASDQVVRFLGSAGAAPVPQGLAAGDPIGKQ
jgi:type IV pilus assembly protein PilA